MARDVAPRSLGDEGGNPRRGSLWPPAKETREKQFFGVIYEDQTQAQENQH